MEREEPVQFSTTFEIAKSTPAKSIAPMISQTRFMVRKRLMDPLGSHKPPNGCSTTA